MEFTYKMIKSEAMDNVVPLLTEAEYKQLLSGGLAGVAAFAQETPVAVLLCRKCKDAVLTLEKIYVEEAYRRQRIGTNLIYLLCSFVDAKKFDLLLSFEAERKDAEILRFLQFQEVFHIEEEEGFEALLTVEEMLAIRERFAGKDTKPQLYFEQTKKLQQDFVDELQQEYPLMAWSLKNDQKSFCKELCCCTADQKGIQAVCLVKDHGEELELHFLYAKGGKGVLAAKALMDMVGLITEKNVAPMRMSLVNETSVNILKKMSKEYEVTKQMYMAYYVGV